MMPDFGVGFLWLLFILACAVVAFLLVGLGIIIWGGVQHMNRQQGNDKTRGPDDGTDDD